MGSLGRALRRSTFQAQGDLQEVNVHESGHSAVLLHVHCLHM